MERSQLFIHTNGFISFNRECVLCNVEPLPADNLPPMIAVLWQNFENTETRGDVFYRVTSDPDQLYLIYLITRQEFNVEFIPSYAVAVTWRDLPESSVQGPMGNNSFQAVVATDGSSSYIIFFYINVDLTRPAEVGFNNGDGVNFFSVASVRDGSSMEIQSRSNLMNVDKGGLYIFRIDSEYLLAVSLISTLIPEISKHCNNKYAILNENLAI